MNNHTRKLSPQAATDLASSALEEKKDWTKPALESFDIGSATQNAGTSVELDGDHAPAQS